jgi:DtxR family transcriptional regulator, Mn-dependent transcriptional regulator
LYKVLDYPIEEVHDEAERLEHFISEHFEERIDAKLGRPRFDPHGHCIPALDGKMPKQASRPLTDIEKDGEFVVDSVSDRDAKLLKRLKAHSVTPGARLHVTLSTQEELVLQAIGGSKPLRLPRSIAEAIRIRSAT